MTKKSAASTIERGQPNQVDKLLSKIATLQKSCQHDFRLAAEFNLKESKVSGVFILPGNIGTTGGTTAVLVQCSKCNAKKRLVTDKIRDAHCPRCLNQSLNWDMVCPQQLHKFFNFDDQDLFAEHAILGKCSNCDTEFVTCDIDHLD